MLARRLRRPPLQGPGGGDVKIDQLICDRCHKKGNSESDFATCEAFSNRIGWHWDLCPACVDLLKKFLEEKGHLTARFGE